MNFLRTVKLAMMMSEMGWRGAMHELKEHVISKPP